MTHPIPLLHPCDPRPDGVRAQRRKAWQVFYGEKIPPNHDLHHVCENPPCRELTHLTPIPRGLHMAMGTQAKATKARHAAIEECPHGHEYTEENTGYNRRSGDDAKYTNRYCRTCRRLAAQARRKEVKE